jgi:ketosteroid isomerase-like protein
MRRVAILSIAATLLIGLSQSTGAQQAGASDTQKAVFALEEEFTRALVNIDTTAFKRITAPGLVYTEDNIVMNQRELINAVVSGDKIEWAGNEDMKLYDYHPVAIVTGILVTKGKNKKGESFENRYRYTDTWLYRDGRWQVIAAQDYLIPK